MKQFTFFIFAGRERFQLGNASYIIIEVFLFWLSFTYHQNSEIKVTVKLIGSTVHNKQVRLKCTLRLKNASTQHTPAY